VDPGPAFQGTLRPYQQVGVRWLHFPAAKPAKAKKVPLGPAPKADAGSRARAKEKVKKKKKMSPNAKAHRDPHSIQRQAGTTSIVTPSSTRRSD